MLFIGKKVVATRGKKSIIMSGFYLWNVLSTASQLKKIKRFAYDNAYGNVIISNWKLRKHQNHLRDNASFSQLSHQYEYGNNVSQRFEFIINPASVLNNEHMKHMHT